MTKFRQFTHINDGFICENCGKEVLPLDRGCRNHCPFCLCSKHVDINPGDRQNSCLGLLQPTGYSLSGKKGLVLHFRCKACGAESSNIASYENHEQPDDYDQILALTKPKV